MSSSLGSISALAGKASSVFGAVNTLFGGSNGVTLGSVVFSGVEVPETIAWGGRQSNSRNVAPGGVVHVSNMGIDYPPIRWTGYFEGFNALARSRALYAMLLAGAPVTLSWNDRMYTVNVAAYACNDKLPNWMPYSITCDVIADQTIANGPPSPSLFSQITSDLTSALGITPDDLQTVATAIQKAQVVAQAAGAVLGGSSAGLALQGAVTGAQNVTAVAQAAAEGNLGGVITSAAGAAASVFPPSTASKGVQTFKAATQAAGDLARTPAVNGYLGRANSNVRNAST